MAIWLRVVVLSASAALGYLTALSGRRMLAVLAAPGDELGLAHYVIFVLPTWLAMALIAAAAKSCLDGTWGRLVGRVAFGCAVGMAALPPLRLALATTFQSAVLPSWMAYLRDRAAVSGGTGLAAGAAGMLGGAGTPALPVRAGRLAGFGAVCGAAAMVWLIVLQEYRPPGGLAGLQVVTALMWGAFGGLAGGSVAMVLRKLFERPPEAADGADRDMER